MIYIGLNQISENAEVELIVNTNAQDHDSEKAYEILEASGLNIEVTDAHYIDKKRMKKLITDIRKMRPKLVRNKTINWKDPATLLYPPILVTPIGTFPWWHLKERIGDIIKELLQPKPKPKLKIKRITNTTQTETFGLSPEETARVNVTMLRAINGTSIYEIVSRWPEEQRAALLIGWRLAQHMKALDLEILSDLIISKAKICDPYKDWNHERHLDIDE
jgi:hypothetical protein